MSMGLSSDSSSCASPAALDWKFSQVFGDKLPGEDVQDIDIISAIEFDKNGSHLAVGDRGGRVVIFESKGGKDDLLEFTSRNELERLDSVVSKHPRFQYKTEFQSHEPEFDYLKSIEIEEKINKVRWCTTPNGSLFILSTNDKTIKLWKVKDRDVKRANGMDGSEPISSENSLLAEKSFINGKNQYFASGHSLQWTEKMENGVSSYNGGNSKIACLEDSTLARCRRVYAHAHDFNVNSISVNRKPHVQTTSRPRRSSLSNLARGFYRQGNDHHSARSNDFSYDFNSKLLHMAWHPTTNLIACAAGNSLLMYYA
ncbi:UNVERIFIED_CONTAM: Serine/threonine protein phosphatase 2A regulatory subunit B alpha isoform [Sesamum radiatum]|uniref:Serine/threonine-protein phosphatase 2A 55 kDa regulatory subunit B n=1 Tax=Sesamum radiatum TaxID=300843 RepID=A0AAW2PM66_SESRA